MLLSRLVFVPSIADIFSERYLHFAHFQLNRILDDNATFDVLGFETRLTVQKSLVSSCQLIVTSQNFDLGSLCYYGSASRVAISVAYFRNSMLERQKSPALLYVDGQPVTPTAPPGIHLVSTTISCLLSA
jgi:hypothetical protein